MLDPHIVLQATTINGLLLAGFLSGGHCLMMCGGIAHLTGSVGSDHGQAVKKSFPRILSYNLGRILGYTSLGALAGLLGGYGLAGAALLGDQGMGGTGAMVFRISMEVLVATMLIFMGIYIGGWTKIFTAFERMGGGLWHIVQPLTRHVLPPKHSGHALILGYLWGFLPCGLVYGALISAFASTTAKHGALTMLFFGLGTLPNLILIGWGFAFLGHWRAQRWFKWTSACLLITWGVLMLFRIPIMEKNLLNTILGFCFNFLASH